MKHIKLLFTTLFFASLLSQCAHNQTHSPVPTQHVPKNRPPHLGEGQHGSYGFYEYTVFKESVTINATSGDLVISSIEVYDFNHDGALDSVFVLDRGVWKFASRLGTNGRVLPQTSSQSPLLGYIGLGNYARRAIERRSETAQKRKLEVGVYQKQLRLICSPESMYPD